MRKRKESEIQGGGKKGEMKKTRQSLLTVTTETERYVAGADLPEEMQTDLSGF